MSNTTMQQKTGQKIYSSTSLTKNTTHVSPHAGAIYKNEIQTKKQENATRPVKTELKL